MSNRQQLFGTTLPELQTFCKTHGLPNFNAKQICEWLYKNQISSIDDMTNLSLKTRELLKQHFALRAFREPQCSQGSADTEVTEGLEVMDVQISSDGTKKYLFKTLKNGSIEAVYMPSSERHTLCISCQMGCRMGCEFCATGKQGFQHNLTAGEILNQLRSIPERAWMTNIVYMGMGEPFDNFDEVMKSLEILTSDWGYAWSPRRINVSTIGLIPEMERFINESECHLAISLHSPFDYERKKMMPVQNKYPISSVIKTLKKYDWSGQRRLSFEYIMFDGINDKHAHLDELTKLLKGLFCRINLIKYHSHPKSNFQPSSEERMIEFRDYLSDHGLICTIRQSRGEDIFAACGLLSTAGGSHELSDKPSSVAPSRRTLPAM
jgi:23S rRNA (adenine2503-C2)-methyltransferase